MDGSFACPECGSAVEVEGLAPGRQVRCGFCHRLLEVPYLPRVPVAGWQRRRFGRSKWVRWAWVVIAVVVSVGAVVGGIRLVGRQFRSLREGSIHKLLASSRDHEAAGQIGMALVDLDAALELASQADVSNRFPIEEERKRRSDLARRDAESTLEILVHHKSGAFPLGEWLNLIARSKKDEDLQPLRARILEEFRRNVKRQSDLELDTARRESHSARVLAALLACDRIAGLLPHLSSEVERTVRRDTEALVARLVETHGVAFTLPRGQYVLGSDEGYRTKFLPLLADALEAKGYLPSRESSPWKSAWQKAFYRMRLEVHERWAANYLSSENRATRIEAHLTLTSRVKSVWETTPTGLTTVPMPGLPAYLARSVAASPARRDEFERLLYTNARDQLDAKFRQALSNMPPCCP